MLWNHLELNFQTEQAVVHMTRAEHASSSREGAEQTLMCPRRSKVTAQLPVLDVDFWTSAQA